MTGELSIRRVAAQDFEAAAGLLAELGRPVVTPATRAVIEAIFLEHVADPRVGSLIAERDGVVVGLLTLHFRSRLNEPRLEAYVPDLIVTEREHGQGVATGLFQRAVELAREQQCHRLMLESGYQRHRAHRFYLREGMTDAGKYFVIKLT